MLGGNGRSVECRPYLSAHMPGTTRLHTGYEGTNIFEYRIGKENDKMGAEVKYDKNQWRQQQFSAPLNVRSSLLNWKYLIRKMFPWD
jgi:hypothetical protein